MATNVDIIDLLDAELRENFPSTSAGLGTTINLRDGSGNDRYAAIRKTIPRGNGANEVPVGVGISAAVIVFEIESPPPSTVSQTLAASTNTTWVETSGCSWNDLVPTITTAPGGNVNVPITQQMVDGAVSTITASITTWIRAILTGSGDNEFSAIMFPSATQALWAIFATQDPDPSLRPRITITYTDRPVITTTGTALAYTSGSGPAAVDDALTVTVEPANVTSATITISAGYSNGADVLAMTASISGITASWNAATGVLTLSGSASKANYQLALRAVTFATTAGAGSRTVSFTLIDENGGSAAAATRGITITGSGGPIAGSSSLAFRLGIIHP